LLASGGMFYRNGSGALMLAHVACGRLIAYYEPAMNSWDCLAGLCLIREAGGWTEAFDASQAGLQACGMAMGGAPQVRSELLGFVSGEAKGSFS
jgi:myo-inositol-1(or 4)-monophosphatase